VEAATGAQLDPYLCSLRRGPFHPRRQESLESRGARPEERAKGRRAVDLRAHNQRRFLLRPLPEGSRLAGDGLASLAYERSSNATNVMVFAEP
jgi:hypothetical protein